MLQAASDLKQNIEDSNIGLLCLSISEAIKNKSKPYAIDVIKKYAEISGSGLYEGINLQCYGLLEPIQQKVIKLDRGLVPKGSDQIKLFNRLHGSIHEILAYISQNPPEFDEHSYKLVSKIWTVPFNNKKKSKNISCEVVDQQYWPIIFEGYSSKSSSLYKFRKSALFDSNINRIISGFLGEKPKSKKTMESIYVLNQILEFWAKYPYKREEIDGIIDVLIMLTETNE